MRSPLRVFALVAIVIAAACAAPDDTDRADEPETTTTETPTTEAPATTEAPTTTAAEPEAPDCDELTDAWLDAAVGSEEETEIETQLAAAGCEVPGLGDVDLEGTLTIEQAGDVATSDMDLADFCDVVAQLGESLAYETWTIGFAGAAEQFGFSDREIFDEVVSRC